FEFCPEGEAIRQREIAAIQARAQALQSELIALQSDPQALRRLIDERVKPLEVTEVSAPNTGAKADAEGEEADQDRQPGTAISTARLMDGGQLRTDVAFAI